MCGIAGLIVSESPQFDRPYVVRRMQMSLTHRGPDDSGMFVPADQRCILAHTRLSIVDLSSAGHQPMSLSKGRCWITYNGEIYNYRELREELDESCNGLCVGDEGRGEAEDGDPMSELGQHGAPNAPDGPRGRTSVVRDREIDNCAVPKGVDATNALPNPQSAVPNPGFTWNSNSDTEVILRAYERWGQDCVHHLRGMFAFAIWDEQRQELFLARDPFGIKPLYYYETDGLSLFASEVRALLASGLVPRKLSREGLASYLQFGSVQNPLTMIEGIRCLLPAHSLVVKCNHNRLEFEDFSFADRLPRTPDTQALTPANRREAATQLRSVLEDSVRAHLVGDVPVAAFLSGGIDSSAIVGLMSRVSKENPRTFNVSFDEAKFSEHSYANLIARKFGTQHEDVRLSEGTLIGMLPGALAAMDQPTMDGINSYVVSKAVSAAGIEVALSGLGGDELFAGYPSFRRAMHLTRLAKTPSAIRSLASKTGRAFNGSARYRKFWDLLESECSPYAAYSISRQLFSPSEMSALMSDRGRNQRSEIRGRTSTVTGLPSSVSDERDVINAVSRYELTGYMANTLLRDTDQMSMAHALEIRVPFIDGEVVNYVMALPGEWKTNGGKPKPLLMDALNDLLPEEIWRRPKMGFILPFQRWMCSTLQGDIETTLSHNEHLARIGIESDYARSVWRAFKNNPKNQPWSRPWALYVLAKWCEINEVTFS